MSLGGTVHRLRDTVTGRRRFPRTAHRSPSLYRQPRSSSPPHSLARGGDGAIGKPSNAARQAKLTGVPFVTRNCIRALPMQGSHQRDSSCCGFDVTEDHLTGQPLMFIQSAKIWIAVSSKLQISHGKRSLSPSRTSLTSVTQR